MDHMDGFTLKFLADSTRNGAFIEEYRRLVMPSFTHYASVTLRRNKRTVWYHVASAFSLLVATLAPTASNEQIKVISNYDK